MDQKANSRAPARHKRWRLGELPFRRAIVWVTSALVIGGAFGAYNAVKMTEGGAPTRAAAWPPKLTSWASVPSPSFPAARRARPLAGAVIAVDPGHNGRNWAAPSVVNRPIWNGREYEACDTSGSQTDSGYTESEFNFNVARYLAADLEAEGATVVMTRNSNSGVGPCVNERAAMANNAHANAAISIHADGGPPAGRGFFVLEPVADGPNDAVIRPSDTLALDIREAFRAYTGEPVSTYFGVGGIEPSDDLAALNLTTVPKVLIECANMRSPTDAALITTKTWQQAAAKGLAAGLTDFLYGNGNRGHGQEHSHFG